MANPKIAINCFSLGITLCTSRFVAIILLPFLGEGEEGARAHQIYWLRSWGEKYKKRGYPPLVWTTLLLQRGSDAKWGYHIIIFFFYLDVWHQFSLLHVYQFSLFLWNELFIDILHYKWIHNLKLFFCERHIHACSPSPSYGLRHIRGSIEQ